MSYVPNRGDIVWINLDPQSGHEQSGRRPAIVLTRSRYNERSSLAILCPITARKKLYPFEVPLPDGFAITGLVLADQAKNLDWRTRQAEFAAAAPDGVVSEVLAKLEGLLF